MIDFTEALASAHFMRLWNDEFKAHSETRDIAAKRLLALRRIQREAKPTSNATVRRMAKTAREALK